MCITCGCHGQSQTGSRQDVAASHNHRRHEDQDGDLHDGLRSEATRDEQEGVRILNLAAMS